MAEVIGWILGIVICIALPSATFSERVVPWQEGGKPGA